MPLAEEIQVARRKTKEFCQRDFSMVTAAFCQLAETTQLRLLAEIIQRA
jgi:hypothetical protein